MKNTHLFLRSPTASTPVTAAIFVLALFAVAVVGGCASEPADSGDATEEVEPSAAPEPAETAGSEPEQDDSMHNTLRWQTASEVDNFGFDVYRGDAEEGPFTKITEDPIAGAGTVDEPQSYVYVDRTNDPTKDYYYYVESISMANVRENFTPVLRAKAKTPPAEDAEE